MTTERRSFSSCVSKPTRQPFIFYFNFILNIIKVVMDIFASLSSSFELGLNVNDEEKLLNLRARSAGLTFCGCAHAAFVCELVHSLTNTIRSRSAVRDSLVSGSDGGLCVGILGLGHLGKQLIFSLLKGRVPTGVECFFDNRRLALWADVLFLCCLPSHLSRVCSELHSRLPKRCLVYSFPSAVPVTSLAELLGHSFVLKPQYEIEGCDAADVWLTCSHLTTALGDPSLIEASCPLTMKGGITLRLNWVCGVLYGLLNICTSACLGSGEALSLINSIFNKDGINNEQLEARSFISSSCASTLHPDEPFPWISLTDAQSKETPLQRFLSSSKSVQQSVCAAYKSFLERPGK
ncbi:NADP-dependent oxidoreductase domain-containing protein 1 isoform X2 [Kryptolebias marmoratus]|uniref:NADP-dependent oxidoreductase domain-containing protein 1 isoform X2 n=1 Tax=Kryptolebias marmoratus TaxID=37003 RepID=UPI0018ACAE1C|nr:NADP-dependent oxidoreductase domain-containing protein 1 isoform X2 [Kryptolebias marmoratus]